MEIKDCRIITRLVSKHGPQAVLYQLAVEARAQQSGNARPLDRLAWKALENQMECAARRVPARLREEYDVAEVARDIARGEKEVK